ncbi:ribonuclease H-like domain-containing protein [Tanacetum coccineum]
MFSAVRTSQDGVLIIESKSYWIVVELLLRLDLAYGAWNMDTGASSHINNSVSSLSDVFNTCIYPSVSVGDSHSIPVTNTGHSILPTPFRSLHLNNVLITPRIVKNVISVCQFVRDNKCIIEFNAFGFSVKDFMMRQVLLRCDSTEDLYPVTDLSPIPHVFLVSQHTWHQRLGHPGSKVLRRLVSNNFILCNKEKPPVLCHARQLGKHVRLPFVSSYTVVTSCFDIIHSDVWTSPILSLPGFTYYILRYVRGTLDYGLQLFSSSTTSLVAYSDVDWVGYPTARRSTSEAEYRGVANAVPATLYLSSNPVQHQRTKHIEIDIHFVRDLIAAGQVRVLQVLSRYQYAYIFTKGLPSALFEEFRTSLSAQCPLAPTAREC